MWRKYLLFSLTLLSWARAQPGNYGYGRDDNYQDNYYAGQQQEDDLYANYAARQQAKAVGGVGWPKLLMAGVGGYLAGATIHAGRLKKKAPKLRFKVKQRVRCNMGDRWAKGTIVQLWTQQEEGVWMPYHIKLDSGSVIYAPADNNKVIRAL